MWVLVLTGRISLSLVFSLNTVPEAHRRLVTGKAASRPRLDGWVYSNFWDCSTVSGFENGFCLWLLGNEADKKRPSLPDLLSAHIWWMWRCLCLGQGDLNVLAVAAICGALVSVCKVDGMSRCYWQSCLLTLSQGWLQMYPVALHNPRAQKQASSWAWLKQTTVVLHGRKKMWFS